MTYTVGAAVLRAAESAREKVLAAASQELEIAPDDLEVSTASSSAVGAPDRSITVEELAQKALRFGGRYEPIEGHGGSAQTSGAPSVAAHLSHVRVDRETGEVELLRHVIAQDVGRALNPALVEGQMRGGATQGMGWALFEELDHDEDGRLLTGSFLDYAIPTAERVPEIETLIVEVPAPDGPFGAKGIGEAPVVGAPAAVANAVAAATGDTSPRAADDTAARLGGAPVVTALERARAVVEAWDEELRRELPENAYLFDVHTHLGNDIDGMVGGYDELTSLLDRYGFRGAFMFCLDEHDREPAFTVPNDRTLAHAERSEGKLIPFVRLDLTTQPLEEARRCLDLGARGIKLHPRAQAFALSDERLQPVFALAVERSVPILIHGGRGLPPIAEDLEALVRRNEGVKLIVAHAGIADMAGLAGRLGGLEGVFFDTSVWSGLDLLDLYRQVAPEQVLYASDYPYGRQPNSLLVAVRTAKLAGFDDKQLRLMLGGSARRMIAGEDARAAVGAERPDVARPTAHVRADPPVHLDGGADALAPPARRHRRAGAGRERLARAIERPSRAVRAHRGAPRDGSGAMARRRRRSRTTTSAWRPSARRSSSSTSPTWSRSRRALA